jgi:glycosyltransferase involved in cell wall biosynthesis
METVALVILNKNDGPSLEKLLDEIDYTIFDKVVAIDGDSKDNSLEILDKHHIQTYKGISGGRGGALIYAFNHINSDFVIFLSSDGEENPADLPKIKEYLLSGYDLVIASRVMDSTSGFKSDHNILYFHRKLYLFIISRAIAILFGGKIKDCWNGYRGMSVQKAKNLNFDASNFLIEAQITIRFLVGEFKVMEFPTIERERYFGDSQNPIVTSGLGHITLLFKEYIRKYKHNKT